MTIARRSASSLRLSYHAASTRRFAAPLFGYSCPRALRENRPQSSTGCIHARARAHTRETGTVIGGGKCVNHVTARSRVEMGHFSDASVSGPTRVPSDRIRDLDPIRSCTILNSNLEAARARCWAPVDVPPTTRTVHARTHHTTRHDTARHGTTRHDATRRDTTRHDAARRSKGTAHGQVKLVSRPRAH